MSKIKFEVLSEKEMTSIMGAPLRERPGVGGYFENFTRGRAPTLETQFGNPLDRQGVLNAGLSEIKSWRGRIPRLVDYELTRVSKYGPQGGFPPISADESVTLFSRYYYASDEPCRIDPAALRILQRHYDADLVPLSPEETVKRMFSKTRLKSNAGIALGFGKRINVVEEAIAKAKRILAGAPMDTPSVLGARAIRNSFRFIFMADFAQNIAELSFIYPMMDWMKLNNNDVAAWSGQTAVVKAINDAKVLGMRGVTHMSTDFTKMDTSMGPAQMNLYVNLTKRLLKHKSDQETWKRMINQFTELPVLVGTVVSPGAAQGQRRTLHLVKARGTHGVLSGLGITNHSETVVNGSITPEMETVHGETVIAAQHQGDDGEMTTEQKKPGHSALAFSKVAARRGLVANVEKQFESPDEIHYLQRVYSPETYSEGYFNGAYPLVLALNSTKNPERSPWKSDPQLREIEIAENCNGHPEFRKIVDFYTSLDPEIITKITDPESLANLNAEHKARVEGMEQEGDQTRTGSLYDFDFVRIVLGAKPLSMPEKFERIRGIDYDIELQDIQA